MRAFLASAAVVLTMSSGDITRVRIALGGVGAKPWRSPETDGPISGASMVTESLVPAVFGAADQAIVSLLIIAATTPGSPFLGHKLEDLALQGGRVFAKSEGAARGVPSSRSTHSAAILSR